MVDFWVSVGRFGVTGILATAIHTAIFLLLVYVANVSPPLATVIAFLCALVFGYRVHHSWTFGAKGNHRTFFVRFALIAVTGAFLNYAIMSFSTDVLALPPLVGLAAVIGVVAPSSFVANRYWAFR